MYVDKRTLKCGKIIYGFTYVDSDGKRRRLSNKKHPEFTDKKMAIEWAKTQAAVVETKKHRIKQRQEWKTKYYDLNDLITQFETFQKQDAPNTYKNNVSYLENYVFYYFVELKSLNNVNLWPNEYESFRVWLLDGVEKLTRSKGALSYSSINNIIHSLNKFVEFLHRCNKADRHLLTKCTPYSDSLRGEKTLNDIVSPEEFEKVLNKLQEIDEDVAELYVFLYRTGLRFNEGVGLPMSFLFQGTSIPTESLCNELSAHHLQYQGYIVLQSQPRDKHRRRVTNSAIERKPLKGRRSIHSRNDRIIPIFEKETWNILVGRYLVQREKLAKNTFGPDPLNYLLFDGITNARASKVLKQAHKEVNLPYKTFHCLRHSFCTSLVGKTRSFFLAQTILGHKSVAVFERYLHLNEAMAVRAKENQDDITFVA